MTNTHAHAHRFDPPFEDAIAYRRRWGRLGSPVQPRPDQWPVFVADHIMLADRHPGSIAFFTDETSLVPQLIAIVPDGPPDPTDEECWYALAGFAGRLCADAHSEDEADLRGTGFGLVIHRDGPLSVTDLDLRWRRAADDLAELLGMHVLGLVARTRCGAIVSVDPVCE